MTDLPTCTIYSMFDNISGIEGTYDPTEGGLKESFKIIGYIWNTEDSRFLHKECHVSFVKGLNKNLDSFAQKEGCEDRICGGLRLFKEVEPEIFEVDGTEFQEPPLEFTIFLLDNEFYAIERICKHSTDQGRKLHGSFHIFSKEFNEKDILFPNTGDLDVSNTKEYIVTRFSLGSSIEKIIPRHERVIKSPDRDINAPRKSINVSISNTKFDINMPYGYLDQIRCWGIVSDRKDSEIDGVECSIELKEYEIDFSTGEYPERDYAGTFFYYKGEDPYVDIELKYKKSDIGDFMKYLIDSSLNASILINCSVNVSEETLSAKNEIQADISHFSISVNKHFNQKEKKAGLFNRF